jgi:tRNA(adenine34) deaminase
MCMGAMLWCHVGRLVFAASTTQLATKIDQIMLSNRWTGPCVPARDGELEERT